MDKQFKKIIIIIIVFLLMLFGAGGWKAVWEGIQTIANVVYRFFVIIIPFLDLTQPIICKVVTIIVVQVLSALGYYISYKSEAQVGKTIVVVTDVIATILMLIADKNI